ncbi:vacuolar protein 8 [Anaeromyces robustus]|uniref:Vacuolar protein 8 n=1 Tax=Anaeromyces robustus TaxID=1754192 RepID=A0A1Y1XD16_9FUNG|nr:vacuolar protein 8 [Anaeromyces robustus]|eukprot:ORX83681.1 vacuolar protein 8 [Anaeromyces robustus]
MNCLNQCFSICFGRRRNIGNDVYEPLLQENERDAVTELLQYLENRKRTDFFQGDPLRTLSTLAYSDNIDLKRSAALAFAEITEKDVREVSRDTLEPIMYLLQTNDSEVQRAAAAALGNLAVTVTNKLLIVQLGGLEPLIQLMKSPNVEVQCNAVGCITNLATHNDNKGKIARSGALIELVKLAKSKDIRVQRNATGALLNMTHTEDNRHQLVNAGAIPLLVSLLNSNDKDVQYYCITAISNIAVDADNRVKLADESRLIQYLIHLMSSPIPKIQCQAALALRNLASDEKFQLEIVECGGLPPLLELLKSNTQQIVLAAVACIRNISIHSVNEKPIVEAGFLKLLIELISSDKGEEIQCHALSTIRNLAASDYNKMLIIKEGAAETIINLLIESENNSTGKGKGTSTSYLANGQTFGPIIKSEMTAALAILALSDEIRPQLFKIRVCDAIFPLTDKNEPLEVQANAASCIGNLAIRLEDDSQFVDAWPQIVNYLSRFLESRDLTLQHIALWTILQFIESDGNLKVLLSQTSALVQKIIKLLKVFNDNLEKNNNNSNNGTIQEIIRIISNISNGLNSMESEDDSRLEDGSNDETSTISNQEQTTNC